MNLNCVACEIAFEVILVIAAHHEFCLLQKLDQIEAEMRRIGYWQENPPDLRARYVSGELRSYLDAPSFELWLQTVFLPNAKHAAQTDTLPKDSQVGLMAMRQYDYQSSVPEAHGLMRLLYEFDDLITGKTDDSDD